MENEILKFHDFPGFPWPVQTLTKPEHPFWMPFCTPQFFQWKKKIKLYTIHVHVLHATTSTGMEGNTFSWANAESKEAKLRKKKWYVHVAHVLCIT